MPRKLRKREGNARGHVWVDQNYDIKQEIRQKNGGIMPETPAFTTSALPYGNEWSEANPPNVLFYLNPPIPDFAKKEPQSVVDKDGKTVMSKNNNGKPLRKIPILPDRISVDVPGWLMVAWRRTDPRITLQDILDRMTTDLGDAQDLTDKRVALPKKNSLQNHCTRNCRKALNYYNGYGRRVEPHRAEVEAVEGLSMNNVRYNTVLKYHPQYDRLVKVKFVRAGVSTGLLRVEQLEVTPENWQETTLPVDHFLIDTYDPGVPENMSDAIMMLLMVQERAMRHGLNPAKWRKLKRSCLPTTWYDRVKNKTQTNPTYDGGCETCTWKAPDEYDWHDLVPEERTSQCQDHKNTASEDQTLMKTSNDSQDANIEDYGTRLESPTEHKRKASDFDCSPPKRRITTPDLFPDLINELDHDFLGLGTWDHNENLGVQHLFGEDKNLAEMLQTHQEQAIEQTNYFEQNCLPNGGYVAVDEVMNSNIQRGRDLHDNSAESLEARLQETLRVYESEQYPYHQATVARSVPNPHDQQNESLLNLEFNSPMLYRTQDGLVYNDPELASMLECSQTLTKSYSQPLGINVPATGVG